MRVRYDKGSDAVYIRFSETACYESDEVKDGIILDFDRQGRVVGLEILDASRRLPKKSLGVCQVEMGEMVAAG